MAINDPTDISGCVLWLDTSTITATDGDPVGSWADQSGNGNDATASGVDRPTYRDGSDFYHGQPTIEYTDQGHRLTVAADSSLDNGEVTYIVVCRLEDVELPVDPKWIFNKKNTNAATIGLRVPDDPNVTVGYYEFFYRLDGSEGSFTTDISRSAVGQSWVVLTFRYDGTDAELHVNEDLSVSVNDPGAIDPDNSDTLTLGNHPSVDAGWTGHFGDVVVYDNAISDDDLSDVVNWLITKYPNSEYTKTGTVLGFDSRHCAIKSAYQTGESVNHMLVVTTSGRINHYTSEITDPHTWTLENSDVIPVNSAYRTLDFVIDGSTWYVYVDKAIGDGEIELWTGAITSLSEHGSSPIISGSTGDHPRTPAVIKTGPTSWVMLVDVRTDGLIPGQEGYLDRWTSSDGISWSKDAVNSPVVNPVGEGFEGSDIALPTIHKLNGGDEYLVAYAGFNGAHPLAATDFPHEIGLLTSTDLISFSRSNQNPIISLEHGENDFDQKIVANPAILDDGRRLYLYYTGVSSAWSFQLGYATSLPYSELGDSVLTPLVSTDFEIVRNGGTYGYIENLSGSPLVIEGLNITFPTGHTEAFELEDIINRQSVWLEAVDELENLIDAESITLLDKYMVPVRVGKVRSWIVKESDLTRLVVYRNGPGHIFERSTAALVGKRIA